MAGNAYSMYTGNVSMTPKGQQALIASPTTQPSSATATAPTGHNSSAALSGALGQKPKRSPAGNPLTQPQ